MSKGGQIRDCGGDRPGWNIVDGQHDLRVWKRKGRDRIKAQVTREEQHMDPDPKEDKTESSPLSMSDQSTDN